MTWQWLLSWWNLIFVAPFAVALLYLGVYTLTGLELGDADADLHGDFDADADADADGHIEADGHVETDADTETDAAHGDGHDPSGSSGSHSFHAMALAWFGVGKVPITIIVIVLMLVWGAAGFIANSAIRPLGGWEAARISLPLALLASLFISRVMVLFMGRFVPLNETYAKRRGELVGCIGEAIYGINQTFGMAMVRDDRGDLHQVACRVASEVPPVEKGAKVKLVVYGAKDRTFFVRQVENKQM
jgi:Protein of unknown function (DUF1449)